MKHEKYFFGFIAIVIGCTLILDNVGRHRESGLEFKGVVQNVSYSENKGTPTITVNNINYTLYSNINFDHQIEVGDTLSKEKGVIFYKLIKKSTGKVFLFDD